MRLNCPNCDAQYEVPDDVIPQAGRDVQCSNCGKTWFQAHPDQIHEDAAEDISAPAPDEEVAAPPSPDPTPPPPPVPPVPVRKELDPDVANILREEAEAEQQARKRDAEALESQPDLGLQDGAPDADQRSQHARDHTARVRGNEPDVTDAAATAAAIGSRRDLLPDIDEINSTLRSSTDRGAPADPDAPQAEIEAPTQKRRKRGFRTGFLLMLLLLVIGLLIYVFAGNISRLVPALDGVLNSYVAWVDQLRIWLDGHVKNMLAWLDNMASRSSGGTTPSE